MGNLLLCLLGADGPLSGGVGLAQLVGQLEIARLGLGGLYLPFEDPEWPVASIGPSIGCL